MNRITPALGLCWLLAGCPFIFEPPPTAGQPTTGSPADADTDTDADTDADTDTDSGTLPTGTTSGTTVPIPPEIVSATATFHYGFARVVLDIQATSALVGGVITVDDGGVPVALSIPSDLAAWDPGGIATLEFATGTPCTGLDLAYNFQVTDFGGRVSNDVDTALVVPSIAHDENERPNVLGTLAVPTIVCGELGNSNDNDGFTFTDVDGDWTLSLHDLTATPLDRDMELLDDTGATLASTTGTADPDPIAWTFIGTETYEVNVFSPIGGSGSEWQVVVHH